MSHLETHVEMYKEADRLAPEARARERELLLDRMNLEWDHVVCDVPAWGGYLAQGIQRPSRVYCIEPTIEFLTDAPYHVIRAHPVKIPLDSGIADRVGSLVGLHHYTLKTRRAVVQEMVRLLKPGGTLVIAEVLDDSAVARFLNGPVNTLSNRGHRGEFFKSGECTQLLTDCGLTDVTETFEDSFWSFDSTEQLAAYCYQLFGMVKAAPGVVWNAIQAHFSFSRAEMSQGMVRLPWPLLYGVGTKPL